MAVHKFLISDTRFNIFSTRATKPQDRAANQFPPNLVVVCHGFKKDGDTTVRGIPAAWFMCRDGGTSDPDRVVETLANLKADGSGGDFHNNQGWRYLNAGIIPNYTLRKELDIKTSKSLYKGQNNYQYVDEKFIEKTFFEGGEKCYDIVSVHNTYFGSRETDLAALFAMLNDKLSNKYQRLLCTFCREAP